MSTLHQDKRPKINASHELNYEEITDVECGVFLEGTFVLPVENELIEECVRDY